MKKVPRSDFEIFKAEVIWQIDRLGLKDWKYNIRFEDIGTLTAQVKINYENRSALFEYNTKYPEEPNIRSDPRVSARHEVAHLLIFELEYLGACRYIDDNEIRVAVEKLAVILEAVL